MEKDKDRLCNKWCRTQDINVPKMNPDTGLKPFTKFISKWIFDLNVKHETPRAKHQGGKPRWPWAGDTF